MSPCARCVLAKQPKDNNTCTFCESRVRYWAMIALGHPDLDDIEPPDVDMDKVVIYYANCGRPPKDSQEERRKGSCRRRQKPKRRKYVVKPTTKCRFPGCERFAEQGVYCLTCYKKIWRRKKMGIPPFATTAEAHRITRARNAKKKAEAVT